eukprot:PITA_33347
MSSETLGNISTLEYIHLTGCTKIEIPPQLVHQRSLKQLFLIGTNLKELPGAIGALSDLEVLKIGSPLLDTLPHSLCELKNLKELILMTCKRLKCLPASLGDLKNLKQLVICDCNALKCLPTSIGLLTQLTELRVQGCPLIRQLPFKKEIKGERETFSDLGSCILPRLQRLMVYGTGISEVAFGEGVCCTLRNLSFSWCANLVEVGTLPKSIISLCFKNCHNLRKIEKLYGFAKLRELCFLICRELEELPLDETMESLSQLHVIDCVKLKSIQGLGQLLNLQLLDVNGCSELEDLEGIQNCMSLESLDASECVKLRSHVDARECPKLQCSAEVVEELRQIEGLELEGRAFE